MELNHKIYSTELTLVEIEAEWDVGTIGKRSETWNWEVTIANNHKDYKGMALESNRNVKLEWRELTTNQPLNEMIERCKGYMRRYEEGRQ